MSKLKIDKYLDWKDPVIYLVDGVFNIEIYKDKIEIECDWDYGWAGRGSETITIQLDILFDLIKEIKEARDE
jgi:hypothetical protein